ncbi:uncharacterized protein LOC115628150 [Scaptodrosophila lebanonensis]|uniref:Uncharacterized protein LOC115628150 n=1 Tax=Drosophila lebanonensis TaxID=7225 RepID=A0A6J2TV67_DROLE|nr:uncharacterized protein LOC115628150 [Scaptodrosophila lebanonensis]
MLRFTSSKLSDCSFKIDSANLGIHWIETVSRVLKPPGGGHTNIFSEREVAVNAPRPKYNQQNSSNLNACMGSTDPNKVVEKLREDINIQKEEVKSKPPSQQNKDNGSDNKSTNASEPSRGRVPPGGYSSGGFWWSGLTYSHRIFKYLHLLHKALET